MGMDIEKLLAKKAKLIDKEIKAVFPKKGLDNLYDGVYYVDYQSAISIGENVYGQTNNSGNAQGGNFAQSGSVGQAIENSGANPSYPNSVFVSLQNRR